MLIIRRTGKRALNLYFDADGAKSMMAALTQLRAEPTETALALVTFGDPSDASTWHGGRLELSCCEENSRIELHKSRIAMEISENLVQLAEDMLEEFLEIGCFFPAEYTSLSSGKRESIDLYFHSLSLP